MGGGGQKVLWRWSEGPEGLRHLGDLFGGLADSHKIKQYWNDRKFRNLGGLVRVRNDHRAHALAHPVAAGSRLTAIDHALHVKKVAHQGD